LQSVPWDGRDHRGVQLGSGIYWVRIRSLGTSASRMIVLVR